MVLLRGIGVSGGIAAGRLSFYKRQEGDIPRYTDADSEGQWRRFDEARCEAVRQIQRLAEQMRGMSEDGAAGASSEAGSYAGNASGRDGAAGASSEAGSYAGNVSETDDSAGAAHGAGAFDGNASAEEAAQILEAQAVMAMDPELAEAVRVRIRQTHDNAEAAVMDAAGEAAARIAALGDDFMTARAADVKDVARRIVAAMGRPETMGRSAPTGRRLQDMQPPEVRISESTAAVPVILAADDLTPGETLHLDRAKILGFVTAGGSAAGHTAILARTMGIPAVIGAGGILEPEYEGQEILMDGDTGEIAIAPDAETRARFFGKADRRRREAESLAALKGKPAVTGGGRSIRLCCNISFPADVPAVIANDAEGIGLFRSECLFLGRTSAPSEEEQFAAYRQVLAAMDGRPVTIRTLDAGSDKQAAYLGLGAEANPALGNRGIRLSLGCPELFRVQLRALARASAYGNLRIMFPMVTSVWEVAEAKKLFGQVLRELRREGTAFAPGIPVGIMVETPAAALLSDKLAKEADFFSIGTNDLTQYTLACDRQGREKPARPAVTDNEPVSDKGAQKPAPRPVFDPHHPAVLRLLELTVKNAADAGIPAGICGELAADREMTEYFLSIGVGELSVPPRDILPLRKKIRNL